MSRAALLGLGILAALLAGFGLGILIRGDPEGTPAWDPTAAVMALVETGEFDESVEALIDIVVGSPSEPAEGGEITGRVMTADGRPLAGALVWARPGGAAVERRSADVPPEFSADLRERILALSLRERREYRRERRAVTDARGCYVLTGIGDALFDVTCWARGFEVAPEDSAAARDAWAGCPVDFVAKPLAEVLVEVRFPDGTPPADAVICVSSGRRASCDSHDVPSLRDWGWQRPWTPERPRLRMRFGTHVMQATSGQGAWATPLMPVVVLPSKARNLDPVVLRLEAQASLAGRVVLPEGADPHLYTLHFRRESNVRSFPHLPGWQVGAFRFTGQDPGNYRLAVTLLGEGVVHSEKVTLRRGEWSKRVLRVTAVPDLSGLVLRVFGPEGRVLPGVSVSVEGAHYSPRAMVGSYVVIPRPDSSFVIRRTDGESDRRPAHWIEVGTPTFGTRFVPFPETSATELSVHMEVPGYLEVKLDAERLVAGRDDLTLYTYPWSVDGYPLMDRSDSREGLHFFGPLQPGTYELRVDEWGTGGTAEGTLVTVTSGRNQITLPGGRDLMRPRVAQALRIARDPEGRTGASGLQVGDLIVGVRERRFRSHVAPRTILRDVLAAHERVTLSVRRDGRALEVSGNCAELSGLILVPGVLEPVFE